MKKFILMMLLVLATLSTTIRAQESALAIGVNMPYGSQFTFYPVQANSADKVYVDWGDGERVEYTVDNSWFNKKVSGKLLSDTIMVYCKLQSIDVENCKVKAMKFYNQPTMEKLLAAHNELTNDGLDLTEAANLTLLDLSDNKMTNLNLMTFTKLANFYVNDNPDFNTAVFADGNANLTAISMKNCDIAHFYPISLPNLQTLNIENGSLMEIELGENYPKLSTLSLSGNNYLEAVDVTSMPELFTLNLADTKITELNLVNNRKLTNLDVHNTQLTSLNIENNENISNINVNNTDISELNTSKLKQLSSLYADSTNISRLDLTGSRAIKYLSARATGIEFLDLHGCIGTNMLNLLDIRDCKNMTAQTLNFTYESMPYHNGVSYRTNVFIAGSNGEHSNTKQLSEENDASNFYIFDVKGDGTASMDEITLTLEQSEGGTYTLSQEGGSTEMYEFKAIDTKAIPGYPIKVSPKMNEGYKYVGVEVNGKLYKDTIFVTSKDATVKPIFANEGAKKQIVLTVPSGQKQTYFLSASNPNTEISIDWGDGKEVKYKIGPTESMIESTGTFGTKVTIIGEVSGADFSSYPGVAYDNAITGVDVSKNSDLTSLILYMNKLGTLNVSNLHSIKALDCSYCELKTLDVKSNTELEGLRAYGNEISDLDLTAAKKLYYLDVKSNNLSELKLAAGANLSFLSAGNNNLASVDLKAMTDLEQLSIQNNKIDKVDLANNKKLVEVNVGNNNIEELNLDNNPLIETLFVDGNKLKTLDVTNQTVLNMINVSSNGWDACTLNDFYYTLNDYVAPATPSDLKTRLWVQGNTTSEKTPNQPEGAESIIATGKGWVVNIEGTGAGCDMAYVTILPYDNGTVKLMNGDAEVNSGDKVAKNTELKLVATPADGYTASVKKVNGVTVIDDKFVVTRSTDVLVKFTISSGVDGVEDNKVTVIGGNNELVIKTDEATSVEVYTTNGMQVFAGTVEGEKALNLMSGVYIVRVKGFTKNVLVK